MVLSTVRAQGVRLDTGTSRTPNACSDRSSRKHLPVSLARTRSLPKIFSVHIDICTRRAYTERMESKEVVQFKELKVYVQEPLHHAFMLRCRKNRRTMAEVLFSAAQAYTNGDSEMEQIVERERVRR